MKPLLPTLKEKKRYLVFEIRTSASLSDASEVVERLQELLGVFGSAEAGLQLVKYDRKRQQGILRCSVASAPRVRAALIMIKKLKGKEARIRVLGLTGILKKTERFTKMVEV